MSQVVITSRNTRRPINTELFTPEIIEIIEDATNKDYGSPSSAQVTGAFDDFFASDEFKSNINKQERKNWKKYQIPVILGISVLLIGFFYWLIFMRKK